MPGVARGRLEPPPVDTPGESAPVGPAVDANHAAVNNMAAALMLARTTVRRGQRIDAVSSTLSPLAGWSLAQPVWFGMNRYCPAMTPATTSLRASRLDVAASTSRA